ncbi:MAG: helix-turn-helix domain-containing protein [Actinobacteria bacterium]|nr:helix-turn-helix domain-containing protein [Actinomycetota bacterium]
MGTQVDTGARIHELRERMSMSQRDVARRSGVPQATLSRIETGARDASAAEVVLIADAIGATVPEITGTSFVADESVRAARAVGEDTEAMYAALVRFLEVSDFLDRQGFGDCA